MANILWIDDYAGKGNKRNKQRMGFDALVYFIEEKGHQVQIASTSETIESALSNINSYDLIILDIVMPPLSFSKHTNHPFGGMDALEKLSESHIKIPIIIFSVVPPRRIRDEARRRGVNLPQVGVKYLERKGTLTPTKLANMVEKYLPKE